MPTVALTYAKTLVDAASQASALSDVAADVQGLRDLLRDSEPFRQFVLFPLLPAEKRSETLQALFGDSLHEVTSKFLSLLIRRERFTDLPDILTESSERLRQAQGIQKVQVTSATKLLVRQQKELIKKLEERTGKKIVLDCIEDDSLIGGFQIKLGDVVEDYSLISKLNTFKENILTA